MGATLDPGLVSDAFRGEILPLWDTGDKVRCRVEPVGRLELPSGRIIACDPVMLYRDVPFIQAAPPGLWPVSVAMAEIGPGHDRVAFARIDFSAAAPVAWRIAVTPGQDPGELADDEIYGYGVDAGMGCFLDADVAAEWLRRERAGQGPSIFGSADFQRNFMSEPYAEYAMLPMAAPSLGNVAAFHSGWGDGFYVSYFGFDGSGALAGLVTDFALFAE